VCELFVYLLINRFQIYDLITHQKSRVSIKFGVWQKLASWLHWY